MFRVVFNWKASVKPRGQKKIESQIKTTLLSFFDDWQNLQKVMVTVLSIGRGGNAQVGVRPAPSQKHHTSCKGVPVRIFTTGTQAAVCLLSVDGLADEELRPMLTSTEDALPKTTRKEASEDSAKFRATEAKRETSKEVLSSKTTDTPPLEQTESSAPETETQQSVADAPELSAYEKLVANGMSEDDVIRLKATLAAILYREYVEQGFKRLPNTLQVPVRHITEGILDHMELPHNAAGTYRGTIANFYATRIALFALKWEDSIDPESRYTDWLFDCKRVTDFVGGKNNLIALARERDKEVQERQETKKVLLEEAPTIAEIAEALSRDPISYEEVIYLLKLFREVQACADRKVALARENEANQQQIVSDLRARLAEEERVLADAIRQRKKAESDRNDLELPADVAQRIIAFRDEATALVNDLGLE